MKKLLPFLALLFFSACKKEEISSTGEFDAPLITGYQFRDPNGLPIGDVGSPNIKTQVTINNYQISLTTYPNPSNRYFSLDLNAFPRFGTAKNVWVTAGRLGKELPQFNFAGSNQAIAGGQPLLKFTLPPEINQTILDLNDFPSGVYRVYVQFDNTLLWDNILLLK